MYTDRSYCSTAPDPYGWPPAGQPNVACMRASGAPSSTHESRWTIGTVADVEPVVVHLPPAAAGLALAVVPALACSTSQ